MHEENFLPGPIIPSDRLQLECSVAYREAPKEPLIISRRNTLPTSSWFGP